MGVGSLQDLNTKLSSTVWDANRPHCLDVDVALASISDEVAYYAVPFWQKPGLLQMGGYGSHRNDVDQSNAQAAMAAPAAAPPSPVPIATAAPVYATPMPVTAPP